MKKEQTPISAFDFLNTKKVLPYQDKFTEGHTLEIMEQYAQAKVLEAIERVWTDIKQQPKESGEYLVSMVGGVDIAMYYKDTNEWKSLDRPLKNAYGSQVIRETLSPMAWMKLPKQK
jgi:hypothetical protein